MARSRASNIQKAERLNLARSLLARGTDLSQTANQLADSCSISKVQAYRYLRQAQQLKRPVAVGDLKVSFTVKLSRGLLDKVRTYAASTGLTLSEIVSRALLAVLHRGGGRG
jgi:predicted DNA-binding transcriptional regulator YafY